MHVLHESHTFAYIFTFLSAKAEAAIFSVFQAEMLQLLSEACDSVLFLTF